MTQPSRPLNTHFGFSGSREEPSEEQKLWLITAMADLLSQGFNCAHHGCCIGSDEWFHNRCKILMEMGLMQNITLHPPCDKSRQMEIDTWTMANCIWYPAKPYLVRNMDIAQCSSVLLALPSRPLPKDGPTGGTWHTINAAQKIGKTVKLCMPDGTTDVLFA